MAYSQEPRNFRYLECFTEHELTRTRAWRFPTIFLLMLMWLCHQRVWRSDVLRLLSPGSEKARLIVTLKLYKVWGNLGERYTELLVLSPAAVMLFHFSICAPVVPSAWKAFPSLMPQLRHGVSQEGFSEAGHMLLLCTPIVPYAELSCNTWLIILKWCMCVCLPTQEVKHSD